EQRSGPAPVAPARVTFPSQPSDDRSAERASAAKGGAMVAVAALCRVWGILVFTAVLLVAVPAHAQEEPDATESEEAVEPEAVLDEIVVTAQKREEDPQDVPVAISTLDTEALETITAGGQDVVQFLSARVPSLLLESSFGRAFPRFYIRGLG